MENKVIVGVDPDSEKIAIAVYGFGELISLSEKTIPEIVEDLRIGIQMGVKYLFSIENVMANNFVYARNNKSTKGAQAAVGRAIGRCQQSQVELMRWLDYLKIPYILHAPTKSNWHDNRALFEKVTGWTKQSNDDTRSAAYFGWLEASKNVSP